MNGAEEVGAQPATGSGARPAEPAWFAGGAGEEKGAPGAPAGEDGGIPLLLEEEAAEITAAAKAAAGVAEVDGADHYVKLPEPRPTLTAPDWARIPPAPFRLPRGIDVLFVRIRGSATAARQKGDRVLVLWGLSDGDEKLAIQRALADSNRAITESAKQMIRAVDGHAADWSGVPGPGNVDQLWRELGGKGRGQLIRLYTQLHVYDAREQADFFENCVALVTTG